MQNSVVQQVAHEFLSARKRQSNTYGEFLQVAHCAIAKLSLLITGPSHTSLRKVTVWCWIRSQYRISCGGTSARLNLRIDQRTLANGVFLRAHRQHGRRTQAVAHLSAQSAPI